MSNFLGKLLMSASDDEHPVEVASSKTKKNSSVRPHEKRFVLGALVLSAVLLCLCVYWVTDTFTVASKAARDAFDAAKEETADKVYKRFYDSSYEAAEEAHHVSNNVSISIGDLNSVQNLEVLRVSDVNYQFTGTEEKGLLDSLLANMTGFFDEDLDSWLEIPGNGVFTVNLKVGEFIVDEDHQYILIRVPNPKLTEFAIDYQNVELLLFEKGGVFKNSAKYGVDRAMEQLKNAESTMREEITNNQEFYERARVSTEKMLGNLVHQLNPQLPDLVVEVEFID